MAACAVIDVHPHFFDFRRHRRRGERFFCTLILTVVVLATGAPAIAGGWTKRAGGGYFKLGSSTFVSDFAYDDEGVAETSDAFILRAQTLYAYGEYGLAERLTVVGFLPFVAATNQHTSGVNFHTLGLGDALLGLQVGIVQPGDFPGFPLVFSARFDVKVPLYDGEPSVRGLRTNRVDDYPRSTRFFPAIGDGQVDLTGWLSASTPIPFIDGFANLDVGYRARTGPVTDAVLVTANVGWFALGRIVLLQLTSQNVFTFDVPEGERLVLGKGFWALGPSMSVYFLPGWALEVGADAVFLGRNAAGGVQVLAGVSYAF